MRTLSVAVWCLLGLVTIAGVASARHGFGHHHHQHEHLHHQSHDQQQESLNEVVPSGNNLYSNLIDGKRIFALGEKDTWNDCQAACLNQTTPPCHSWTYFFANYTADLLSQKELPEQPMPAAGSFSKLCYGRTDNFWNPQFSFGNKMVSGVNPASPPSTAIPNPPPPDVQFSWDHVPVFFHSSNTTGPFNEEALRLMAKFPLVTIEKYQGPHSGYHYPKEQWVCCEEDRIVEVLQAVKKINPNVTGIFYYNMILDFPQYRLHQNFAKNESWWLHDDQGKVIHVGGDGHNLADLLVYDTTQAAVSDLFIHACYDLLATGAVDGCFVDRPVDGAPSKDLAITRQQDLLLSHITTLQKFQTMLKRGPLIANHAYSVPGINAVMIEAFRADEESIQNLIWCAARGKLTEAHMVGGDCNTDEGIQDPLAAFLIGAGEYSYFGCGPWFTNAANVNGQWKASYDKPLGAPQGPAIKEGTVYTRKFSSGTVVEFDVSKNKGSIHWGTS